MSASATRTGIYYWKCDRAAAFHGTAQGAGRDRPEMAAHVRELVAAHFGRGVTDLRDGGGQGNHLTFIARVGAEDYFVRLEDGPEADDYLAVESLVMERVRRTGVPTPRVYASDASRNKYPFAWQIMDCVPQPDLNRHFKSGSLNQPAIAGQLGRLIARWQGVPVEGFGPFRVDVATGDGRLAGLHATYQDYHSTRLGAHLQFLRDRNFLAEAQVAGISAAFEQHRGLLELRSGCLVHKDLALWNVLGSPEEIAAVIDWDDCIAGDPMDDLALLGCFHDGAFLRAAFAGYASVRPLPDEAGKRFWLHLLRNMIFKAVIRVGAGYFDHGSGFFLVSGSGPSLREQTLGRLERATDALQTDADPFSL